MNLWSLNFIPATDFFKVLYSAPGIYINNVYDMVSHAGSAHVHAIGRTSNHSSHRSI